MELQAVSFRFRGDHPTPGTPIHPSRAGLGEPPRNKSCALPFGFPFKTPQKGVGPSHERHQGRTKAGFLMERLSSGLQSDEFSPLSPARSRANARGSIRFFVRGKLTLPQPAISTITPELIYDAGNSHLPELARFRIADSELEGSHRMDLWSCTSLSSEGFGLQRAYKWKTI